MEQNGHIMTRPDYAYMNLIQRRVMSKESYISRKEWEQTDVAECIDYFNWLKKQAPFIAELYGL